MARHTAWTPPTWPSRPLGRWRCGTPPHRPAPVCSSRSTWSRCSSRTSWWERSWGTCRVAAGRCSGASRRAMTRARSCGRRCRSWRSAATRSSSAPSRTAPPATPARSPATSRCRRTWPRGSRPDPHVRIAPRIRRVQRQTGPRGQVGLAVADQFVVRRLTHQLDQLGTVAEVDRLVGDVRLGVPRAVPVQVVPAGTPTTAVVLTDRHLGVLRAVRRVDLAERAADRQLPAHVRLGLQRAALAPQRQCVQRAALSSRETGLVEEDARAFMDGGLAVTLVVGVHPRVPGPGARVEELPLLAVEELDEPAHALLVVAVGEVRAECAAAVVRPALVDAAAALAEDAHPPGREPGQVALEDLGAVLGIDELDERARKDEIDLGHRATLRRRGRTCALARH